MIAKPQEAVMKPQVAAFFDEPTNTISYVVKDPKGSSCAIIDSVLDFDYSILETHVHADHLSAAPYLQERLGGKIGIGENITIVQDTFGKVFNEGTEFQRDGSQFDELFVEGDSFHVGQFRGDVLHTPGHTPACMTYVIGDAAFVGDTLFMPDFGTARCDFPGGSADTMYESVQKILSLPDETRIFVGHDYKAPGRDEYAWETTVGEQKAKNVHVGGGASREEFVKMRTERDETLAMPKLIIPSLQVNMRAGNMPEPDDQGDVFLKVPVNKLGK
jgi:glyoxylase-like metal-dependent hydrolase (beta-lactamase superfamily II)